MIRPEGIRTAAFALAADGDARVDDEARAGLAARLGITDTWATVSQVHGAATVVADRAGGLGEADALFTAMPSLPLAVGTADCLPIVVVGGFSVALIHAGWRGLDAGVVASALAVMEEAGDEPQQAAIGPCIGPCCYEVGEEVAARFGPFVAATSWGTPSVDLRAAAVARLRPIPVWVSSRCTRTDPELHSHRENGTRLRQVTVAWAPTG